MSCQIFCPNDQVSSKLFLKYYADLLLSLGEIDVTVIVPCIETVFNLYYSLPVKVVTVKPLTLSFKSHDAGTVHPKDLTLKNPGSPGSANVPCSSCSMETTSDIVGLPSARCWTHNRPTWMHREILVSLDDFSKTGSISSKARPSFHNAHA